MASATLDALLDDKGLCSHTSDDWSDVKHSERKKRDRILDDDVILRLIEKKDAPGLKRLAAHLIILFLTGMWIHVSRAYLNKAMAPFQEENPSVTTKTVTYLPLCFLRMLIAVFAHGFVLQCLAYCVQHECMHGTAFKTR